MSEPGAESLLAPCPACGKQISKASTTCIHCGHPIAATSQQPVPVVQRQGAGENVVKWVFGIIGGLILAFLLVYFLGIR